MTIQRFNAADPPKDWMITVGGATDVQRVRLFAVDEEISNIMTSERTVYGGGPGEQQYLLLVETTEPDAATSVLAKVPERIRESFLDHGWLEISHEWKGESR